VSSMRWIVAWLRYVTNRPSEIPEQLIFYLWRRRALGQCGPGSFVGKPIAIIHGRHMSIGRGSFIREGARLEVVCRPGLPPGRLEIGDHVSIEQGAHIVACDRVIIEDYALLAPRSTIIDATHAETVPTDISRARQLLTDRVTTRIRRGVMLGANVVVFPGVTIGENSIIGANSVVTRDIPANCVAVGNPAKVVRPLRTP
jgi:acetyltransferase-like isoleucine patch superfamily enzyme